MKIISKIIYIKGTDLDSKGYLHLSITNNALLSKTGTHNQIGAISNFGHNYFISTAIGK
jgi:hypothetical protein